jgi:hypothetical protein
MTPPQLLPTEKTRRTRRLSTLERATAFALVIATGVIVPACGGSDGEYLCQRQLVTANRGKITPLADKSYKSENVAAAEDECIADSADGAAAGVTAECSCSPSGSSNRIAPTAPIAN